MDRFYELDDLLQSVLRRRADQPMPPDLSRRLSDALRRQPQGRRARFRPSPQAALRLALLAIPAAFVAGAAVFAILASPRPGPATGDVLASPTATPPAASASARPSAPPTAAAPTASPVPSLRPDAMAVVTEEGTRLSVHSAPGVDTGKLRPVLLAGTRMFIVDGPVAADGYSWYEVQPEYNTLTPFGWVAAADKNGVAWIEPADLACPADPAGALATHTALEFLACYGAREVSFVADAHEVVGAPGEPACALTPEETGCVEEPTWLMGGPAATVVDLDPAEGAIDPLPVFFSPESATARSAINLNLPTLLTGSMSAPEAADCRVTDPTGHNLVPRDQAILRCRSRFVVRDLKPAAAALANPGAGARW